MWLVHLKNVGEARLKSETAVQDADMSIRWEKSLFWYLIFKCFQY